MCRLLAKSKRLFQAVIPDFDSCAVHWRGNGWLVTSSIKNLFSTQGVQSAKRIDIWIDMLRQICRVIQAHNWTHVPASVSPKTRRRLHHRPSPDRRERLGCPEKALPGQNHPQLRTRRRCPGHRTAQASGPQHPPALQSRGNRRPGTKLATVRHLALR